MAELRRDPVTGRWVSLAPGRAVRPESAPSLGGARRADTVTCPFCEGREQKTPPEVAAVRDSGGHDTPGWRVRVVPNLYPAFSMEEGSADLSNPLHESGPALGACEVIIHSPDHDRWLPLLSAEQVELSMRVTWERYRVHASEGMASVVVLYNHGKDAGASLAHPHGQLFASRIGAPVIDEESVGAAAARATVGGCVFCRMLREEEAEKTRLIYSDDAFVAIAPWASRSPYEAWIIPRVHHADYGAVDAHEAAGLAAPLRSVLSRIVRELGDLPINWYLHSLPNAAGEAADSYHWHIEIRPKLTIIAGFELATGTYINTVAPELAAEQLRAHPEPSPGPADLVW